MRPQLSSSEGGGGGSRPCPYPVKFQAAQWFPEADKVPKPELNMAGLTSLPGTETVWSPITSTFSPNPEVRVRLSPLGRPEILPFPSLYQHLERAQESPRPESFQAFKATEHSQISLLYKPSFHYKCRWAGCKDGLVVKSTHCLSKVRSQHPHQVTTRPL